MLVLIYKLNVRVYTVPCDDVLIQLRAEWGERATAPGIQGRGIQRVKLQKINAIKMVQLDPSSYCKATNTHCMHLMGNLPEEGHANLSLSDPREREVYHCHRYPKALHSICLLPFVGWRIAADLLLICSLSSKYLSIL